MTTKEIYESIDQSKISPKGKDFLQKAEKSTKGFTIENEKLETVMRKIYKDLKERKPEALKNVKVKTVEVTEKVPTTKTERKKEPKKTTKTVKKKVKKASGTKKNPKPTKTPSTPKEGKKEHISTRASKLAKKEGITFKEARAKISKLVKEESKKAEKQTEKELDKLLAFVRKESFEGEEKYPKTYGKQKPDSANLSQDAKRRAKPVGKRVSKNGKTYYEYRDNRSDRNSLPAPKGEYRYKGKTPPFLEAGGTLPTPFGQAGLVGETGAMNEMDLFAMGGGLPQGVHQYYGQTYNPAYLTPHGYAEGGYLEGKTYYIVNYYSSVSDIPNGIALKNKSFGTKEDANTFLKSIENKNGRGFVTDFKKPTRDEISKLDRDRNENYMMAKGGIVNNQDENHLLRTAIGYAISKGNYDEKDRKNLTEIYNRLVSSKFYYAKGGIVNNQDENHLLRTAIGYAISKGNYDEKDRKNLTEIYNRLVSSKFYYAKGGKLDLDEYYSKMMEKLGKDGAFERVLKDSQFGRYKGQTDYQHNRLNKSAIIKDGKVFLYDNKPKGDGSLKYSNKKTFTSPKELAEYLDKNQIFAKGGEIDAFIMSYVKGVPEENTNLRVDTQNLTAKLKKGGKLGYAKGGEVLEYSKIYEILKEKVDDAVEDIESTYEQATNTKGEEVEYKSRDGFIPFTNGGYSSRWFEYSNMLEGSGMSLPTASLDDKIEEFRERNREYGFERFEEEYPEIVKELGGIDNVSYSELEDAGYSSEADDLDMFMQDDDDSIMMEVEAYYYNPNNDRGEDGKHTIQLSGVVNLEAPYHRSGNLEDYVEERFTFDSYKELEDKLDKALAKVVSWFEGDMYDKNPRELKIRRMEAGGTLPTPFGQAGLVGETGAMNEMDLFAMGGDLPQGVHQYYAQTYNPAYPTPHGYAKGGRLTARTRFTDYDFDRLSYDFVVFDDRVETEDGKVVGTINSKGHLIPKGDKTLKNPLVKWLQQNSYVSNEEYQKLAKGGELSMESYWDMMIKTNLDRIKRIDKIRNQPIKKLKEDKFNKNKSTKEIVDNLNELKKLRAVYKADNNKLISNFGGVKKYSEYLRKEKNENTLPFAKGGEVESYVVIQGKKTKSFGSKDSAKSYIKKNGGEYAEIINGRLKVFKDQIILAKGGKTQGYNDKLDESLGNTKGKRSTKEQNYKDRRNESEAMEKKSGKRKYARVKTMDKSTRKKRKTPMTLAKAIRRDGEKWQDAVKRATMMMKKEK